MSRLRTHRRGQAEAHRPQAGAGQPAARLLEFEKLRAPHLVLADADRNHGIAIRRHLGEHPDRVLLQNALEILVVLERIVAFPLLHLLDPFRDLRLWFDVLVQLAQRVLDLADDRKMSRFVLVQL